jgi:light-harvesting complex 1 alpha chain
MAEIPRPKNPEDDWKIWLVINPATWLMPILFSVFLLAIVECNEAWSAELVQNQGFHARTRKCARAAMPANAV